MEDNSTSSFQVWKPETWFSARILGEIGNLLYTELQKRKIDKRRGPYQIRWGYDNSRNFDIKEASSLERGDNNMLVDKKWV